MKIDPAIIRKALLDCLYDNKWRIVLSEKRNVYIDDSQISYLCGFIASYIRKETETKREE